MARGFGSTLGVGATDAIDIGLGSHATQRTWAMQINRNGSGGNATGRVFDKNAGTAQTESLIWSNAANAYRFERFFTSGSVRWDFSLTATNTNYSIVLRYDSSAIANNATAFVDGTSQALTRTAAAPSGSALTTSDNYCIGNRLQDQARVWDGTIAEFAIWNELIPTDIAIAISAGYSPAIYPRNLIYYAPLIRDIVDLRGGITQTVTGTAARAHPRITYPYSQPLPSASDAPPANTNISIALSGNAATISGAIRATTNASIALSGSAATISATATIHTNSTISLIGNAATIAATAGINTNSAIALTGAAATISGTVAIGTITTALISLQGEAATISATIEPTTQASISLTGNAATIAATVQTTVQGAIALTGSPATIAISARSETLGAIALLGSAATISAQVSVSNPVDPSFAISLQGEAATIAIGVRTTSRMAIALTGSAAIFQVRIGSGSTIVISQVSSKVLQKLSSSRVVKLSSTSLAKNSRVI